MKLIGTSHRGKLMPVEPCRRSVGWRHLALTVAEVEILARFGNMGVVVLVRLLGVPLVARDPHPPEAVSARHRLAELAAVGRDHETGIAVYQPPKGNGDGFASGGKEICLGRCEGEAVGAEDVEDGLLVGRRTL
jgi:hypothetical protein